ncbi:MAG: 3-phosphoserine/phosphohydroxythreonine transaminase [Clostridia bacterium]|nr:3-phosphoserine/phosphohydroxythreonine transaminase [Clostridia bacterium]
MKNRVYNFSSGPAVMPEPVLEKAAKEMLNYAGSGMSVMEMSHRSAVYDSIIKEAEKLLRELMNIPDEYAVLFLQGGASLQFAMLPMNLACGSGKVDIVHTGMWSGRALAELKKLAKPHVVASSEDKTFTYIPELTADMFDPEADYVHVCWNNTIYGTKYSELPPCETPLVADMSSCILSEPVDVKRFGCIFAGAQKNLGPAGLTIVIIRRDLTGKAEGLPTMLDYVTHIKNASLYNTPPTYAIYMCKLVLEWLKDSGGVEAMAEINRRKAKAFYDFLDASNMFRATVRGRDRSIMNIPFVTGDDALNAKFIAEADAAGFVNLKGHRSVGGMRASIYNAMPEEGVLKLIEFMEAFEKKEAR